MGRDQAALPLRALRLPAAQACLGLKPVPRHPRVPPLKCATEPTKSWQGAGPGRACVLQQCSATLGTARCAQRTAPAPVTRRSRAHHTRPAHTCAWTDAKRQTRDWPDYRSKSITARAVFDGYLQNGFKDVSWGAWMQNLEDTKNKGMLGGRGMCATVSNKVRCRARAHAPLRYAAAQQPTAGLGSAGSCLHSTAGLPRLPRLPITCPHTISGLAWPQGAFALRTYSGIFQNTVAIEFWTYVGFPGNGGHNAKIPDITVSISGPKASRARARACA